MNQPTETTETKFNAVEILENLSCVNLLSLQRIAAENPPVDENDDKTGADRFWDLHVDNLIEEDLVYSHPNSLLNREEYRLTEKGRKILEAHSRSATVLQVAETIHSAQQEGLEDNDVILRLVDEVKITVHAAKAAMWGR